MIISRIHCVIILATAFGSSGAAGQTADEFYQRGVEGARHGRYGEAVADFGRAIRLAPGNPSGHSALAWLRATCPDPAFRDGKAAVRSATRACELTSWAAAGTLDTLAAAYAEAGDFDAAARWQGEAIRLAADPAKSEAFAARLALYRRRTPYRIVAGTASAPATPTPEDVDGRAACEEARRRGLRPFKTWRSEHFIAVGNAGEVYSRIALRDCEAVARDFIEHYTARGFRVAFPARPMVVVILEDDLAFQRFLGLPSRRARTGASVVLGLYQRRENRLVLQDFRNVPGRAGSGPAWSANLSTLAHEATHLLTFNVGLLERVGDVPSCVVEGLAAYGEVRRPDARLPPGQLNRRRLDDLAHSRRKEGWIPLTRLLSDDGWLEDRDSKRAPLGYAEGWLLVHYLMSDPARAGAFRDYLDAIWGRRDRSHRLEDARSHLGDLEALDRALKEDSLKLLRMR